MALTNRQQALLKRPFLPNLDFHLIENEDTDPTIALTTRSITGRVGLAFYCRSMLPHREAAVSQRCVSLPRLTLIGQFVIFAGTRALRMTSATWLVRPTRPFEKEAGTPRKLCQQSAQRRQSRFDIELYPIVRLTR